MKTTISVGSARPLPLRAGAACAALLYGQVALAQTAVVTPIALPGAPVLSVTALNESGQLAGYYYDANSLERAFLWTNGVVTELGTLGGARSVANGLNNLGQVVGYSSTAGDTQFRGFVWTLGTMLDYDTLGGATSAASAINDASQATGYSYVSSFNLDYHAFLSSGTQLQDLGTLGGRYSFGVAVNSAGLVAGESATLNDAADHAFLFSNGVMMDLGTLGGSVSTVYGLNNQGWVTGDSTTANGDTRAYVHNGSAMLDLGTLGGTYSMGFGINDAGQVIGDATTVNEDYHGFIWSDGVMQDLGSLGGGFSSTWDVNNLGQVVGVSSMASGRERAFVWQNGSMLDLNSLLPANSGWQLSTAIFINDAGQIAGRGFHQGQESWFLLTVVGNPNQPPVANAGSDQTIECAGATTMVTVDGSASSDPEGGSLTYAWFEGNTALGGTATLSVGLAAGSHTLTLRVTDQGAATAEDTVVVNVVDTTPPVVQCPANVTVAAGANCLGATPDFLASLIASDICTPSAQLTTQQVPAAGTPLGLGAHPVTITVADMAGNVSTCVVQVTVADQTAPVIASVTSNPTVLSPINRHLVPVTVTVVASDNCDPQPSCSIVAVSSSEPVTGQAETSPDWIITGDLTLQLRAENTWKDAARVYTITVACTDAAGNTSTQSVTVTAAKNKAQDGSAQNAASQKKRAAQKSSKEPKKSVGNNGKK